MDFIIFLGIILLIVFSLVFAVKWLEKWVEQEQIKEWKATDKIRNAWRAKFPAPKLSYLTIPLARCEYV